MADKKSELKYGLIGKTLGHSFSPQVHSMMGDYEYGLYSCETADDMAKLLRDDSFGGFNVTIPYKKDVMELCDVIDKDAARIGAVNTVVRGIDGKLTGYNTDYYGFKFLLDAAGIEPKDKMVLVLGAGGASVMVQTALEDMGASEVNVVSRHGNNKSNESQCESAIRKIDTLDNMGKYYDSEVIINTTPVGMYPNNGESLINLDAFKACAGVVDLIYNPEKTKLVLDAEKKGIATAGGLLMLIAQAAKAKELFMGDEVSDEEIVDIAVCMLNEIRNVIIIGMPGSGKTMVGKGMALELGLEFVDTDDLVEQEIGMPIPEFFEKFGEAEFRKVETSVLAKVTKEHGLIIATGGGIVTREENYDLVRQNGFVIWLKRDLDKLAKEGRPISLSRPLEEVYEERKGAYEKWSDTIIDNNY